MFLALGVQATGVFVWYHVFENHLVSFTSDSPRYVDFRWSYPEIWGQLSGPAYPAFLKLVWFFDPKLVILPDIQLVFHLGTVLFFAFCLVEFGFSEITALAAASPLLYANTIYQFHSVVQTDSMACSLGLLSVACLLLTLRHPSSLKAWTALVFSLFCAYQVRPAYVFLVGLVPALGIVLGFLRYGVGRLMAIKYYIGAKLGVACLGPFLLFCGLRWFVVGHFGLVSFGGYNLVGIVSQFLNPGDEERLPPEFQPITRAILRAQNDQHLIRINSEGYRVLSFQEIQNNYNIYIYKIIAPYLESQQILRPVPINTFLVRFSKALLLLHPESYRRWLIEALTKALGQYPDPMWLLCLSSCLALTFLVRTVLTRSTNSIQQRRMEQVWGSVILAIGLGHFAANIVLVVLVEPPIARYLDAAYVYFPSILILGITLNTISILRMGRTLRRGI